MFLNNNFTSTGIAALKLLRMLVRVIVTAGFVPTFGILTTPFDCGQMKQCVAFLFSTWAPDPRKAMG